MRSNRKVMPSIRAQLSTGVCFVAGQGLALSNDLLSAVSMAVALAWP